ncbi:MAG TPA: LLM class flavin-dependent oxidoreductase [Acidimicrobiia bacterium]|nr:LLM class flavin-dependent oxidoreductase [Acidimicrobiia bacterium]
MFMMRFDMRAPEFGGATTDLYQAAIDMAEWAETRGCMAAVISEHHTSSDGYIPSPLLLASAMAARTHTLHISIAAALLAFYDPIRLAEDMIVLDIISKGRLSYTLGLGYRPEEFEMYGIDWKRRGAVVEEKLQLLLKAKTGEPFEHEGRRIHVTPAPITPGGPMVMWGGGSIAAAKRAGRYGLGFFAQSDLAGMKEAYEQSCREHGFEPGMAQLPPKDAATTMFVADDVDKAWAEVGEYILHDVKMYGDWNPGDETTASISHAQTVDELRATSPAHKIYSTEEATEIVKSGMPLMLMPLCGGIPPKIAWPYLEHAVEVVERAQG